MPNIVKSNQRGDTIVEVLIVLAVLGLAIGISYATANRSLMNARQAQESAKATELLRSQLESVRVLAKNGASAPADQNIFVNTPFCISSTTATVVSPAAGSSNPCRFDDLYEVTITQDNNKFTLRAQWEDVAGQGTDSATLVYRWYKL